MCRRRLGAAATERCCSRPRRSRIPRGIEVGTMPSNRIGSNGRSAATFADDSTPGASLFGQVPLQKLGRDGVGDSGSPLACAVVAVERVEREIDYLWRNSMT